MRLCCRDSRLPPSKGQEILLFCIYFCVCTCTCPSVYVNAGVCACHGTCVESVSPSFHLVFKAESLVSAALSTPGYLASDLQAVSASHIPAGMLFLRMLATALHLFMWALRIQTYIDLQAWEAYVARVFIC